MPCGCTRTRTYHIDSNTHTPHTMTCSDTHTVTYTHTWIHSLKDTHTHRDTHVKSGREEEQNQY